MNNTVTLNSRFAFVDIETTGLKFTHNRIIEVGIILVENGKVLKKFNQLINPEEEVPAYSFELTGISPQELKNAYNFRQHSEDILALLENATFVAHNARFDYSFLREEFKRIGVDFKAKTLCTVKLSRHLFPEHSRHSLDHVVDRCNITVKNRHRAYDDAEALWKFLKYIKKQFSEDHIHQAFLAITKTRHRPPHLDEDLYQRLPEAPGVYIFYGQNGEVLYIGKSVNIKERVASHFHDSLNSNKEMSIFQSVHHIEARTTAGDFSALMLESRLIKEMQPMYNRLLRRIRKLTVLEKTENEGGYYGANIQYLDGIDAGNSEKVLGIFKSKKKAEEHLLALTEEFKLCRKLLGIEKSKKECFLFQLKKCSGACAGHEASIHYNMRFLEAFENSRIRRWPFSGPILVEEKFAPTATNIQRRNTKGEVYIIDQWCIIAQGVYHEDSLQLSEMPMQFDYDTYKILNRHMRKNKLHYKPISREEIGRLFAVEY